MAMHMRAATGNAEHSDAFLAGLEKREAEREAQRRADEAERKAQHRADEAERKEQRRADEVKHEAQRRADEAQHRADEAKRSADQDRFIATVQRELTLQRWFFVAAVAAMGLVVTAISVA